MLPSPPSNIISAFSIKSSGLGLEFLSGNIPTAFPNNLTEVLGMDA
jgi:hypothetical protein